MSCTTYIKSDSVEIHSLFAFESRASTMRWRIASTMPNIIYPTMKVGVKREEDNARKRRAATQVASSTFPDNLPA